jgi:predicted dienelactone hydrolase
VPYTVSHLTLSNAGRSWGESIYTPTSPGLHPVVSVNAGTQQVNAAYAIYGQRLASYGIVALLQDDEGFNAPTPNIVDDVTYVITSYVPANLAATADMTRVGLSGHSRGGKATLLAAENAVMGKVKAWFGLDPVDVDFQGTPGALPGIGTIGIPLGFAGATVSSNCSPANANYEVYYAAASPPAVAVTIEGAGHFDFLDQSKAIAEFACTPEGTANPTVALNTAAHYLMAFFARELLGDSSVGPALDGAGAQTDIAAGIIAVESK